MMRRRGVADWMLSYGICGLVSAFGMGIAFFQPTWDMRLFYGGWFSIPLVALLAADLTLYYDRSSETDRRG